MVCTNDTIIDNVTKRNELKNNGRAQPKVSRYKMSHYKNKIYILPKHKNMFETTRMVVTLEKNNSCFKSVMLTKIRL